MKPDPNDNEANFILPHGQDEPDSKFIIADGKVGDDPPPPIIQNRPPAPAPPIIQNLPPAPPRPTLSIVRDPDSLIVCPHPGCGRRFRKPCRLRAHQFLHSSDPKPFKCEAEGCGSSYSMNQHLKRHIQSNHCSNGEGEFKCVKDPANCQASFPTYKALSSHINRSHYYSVPSTSSSTKRRNRRNIKNEESEEDPSQSKVQIYTCSACPSFSSPSRNALIEHLRTPQHQLQLPIILVCSYPNCGQTFTTKSSLTVHSKIHCEVRTLLKCPHEPCTRSYYYLKNLKFHIKSRHEDNGASVNKNNCEFCGKTLSTKQKLIQHLNKFHAEGQGTEAEEEDTKSGILNPNDQNLKYKYKINRAKLAKTFSKKIKTSEGES